MQRPQIVGCAGSCPTSSRQCQQRSHLVAVDGAGLALTVTPSTATKCERCWHWREDVGHDAAHPTLCGRCTANLYGAGEARHVA